MCGNAQARIVSDQTTASQVGCSVFLAISAVVNFGVLYDAVCTRLASITMLRQIDFCLGSESEFTCIKSGIFLALGKCQFLPKLGVKQSYL